MVVLHFTTHSFSLTLGGLEVWTFRLAKMLSENEFKVIVYVLDEVTDYDHQQGELGGVEIKLIFKDRMIWEEPLENSTWPEPRLILERYRLNFLLLRCSISKEIETYQYAKHILISNFLLGVGFVSSTVAEDLNIPHIACVVGTDFSRGFRNSRERSVIEMVVEKAAGIVTKSGEQAEALKKKFHHQNIKTIHTSLDPRVFEYSWNGFKNRNISLFSDGGYSHKKGTQVLIWAYEQLMAEGFPLTLEICGSTLEGQESYWNDLRKHSLIKIKSGITFLDHLSLPEVWQRMQHSSVYCAPTLGEGCSHARAAALCMGMPIVTTACGEIRDIVTNEDHVRVVRVGDAEAFLSALRKLCKDLLSSNNSIGNVNVQPWRRHFSPERELEEWLSFLQKLRN